MSEQIENIQSPSRLRLTLFRPTLGQGGADRVTITLLQALNRKVFEPSLVLMRAEGELVSEIPLDVPLYALNVSNIGMAWRPLARYLQKERPNILFSTSSGGNVSAALAHVLGGKEERLVLSERNVLVHGKSTIKKRLILKLKGLLYGQADHITAVSEGVKADLVQRLGLAPQRISVVYNPIVTKEMEMRAQALVEHPWFWEEIPIVLGVGRLVPEKDFATLVEAFAKVRARRQARLVILGEGSLKEYLLALVQARGLAADVWFAGFDKNPFKYMSKCTVFVLASQFEGLPGVLIQAMACGAPVIATDCPSGPSEIIAQPNTDGLLIPVGDVDTLAQRIGEVLDNPELRKTLAANGRASVQRFDVDAVMKNYEAALLGANFQVQQPEPMK